MNASPESCAALVLNADFRPLSYFPLSLWPWQETIKAVFLDRVNIVSQYDRVVHSPNFEMKLPHRGRGVRESGLLFDNLVVTNLNSDFFSQFEDWFES